MDTSNNLSMKCKGITLKNAGCLKNAKYNGYCLTHTNQRVKLNSDTWSCIIMLCVETDKSYNKVSFNYKKLCTIFCVVDSVFNDIMNRYIKPFWFKCLVPKNDKRFTDISLKCIAKNIISLDLYCNEYITNAGLKTLKNLTDLKLWYNYTITDNGIKNLTNLKTLNLCRNEKITNWGLFKLTNLTHLDLSGDKINDNAISKLINLKNLAIRGCPYITDDSIRQLTNLICLHLNSTNYITDESIKILTKLNELEIICQQTITSTAILHLINLQKLIIKNAHIFRFELTQLTNLNIDDS